MISVVEEQLCRLAFGECAEIRKKSNLFKLSNSVASKGDPVCLGGGVENPANILTPLVAEGAKGAKALLGAYPLDSLKIQVDLCP